MQKKTNFIVPAILITVFCLYTAALTRLNLRPVGPRGSSVGFAALNLAVHKALGVNMKLYTLTDWLSLAALPVMLGFALLGLVQLIRRKSLFKVDGDILALGGFYLAVLTVYIYFEINVINYRPVLIDAYLEASYPSSTTMLMLCVMPTAMMQFSRRIHNKRALTAINASIGIFTAAIVLGRLISGVHWFTDILGGILLSAALVSLYRSVTSVLYSHEPSAHPS